MAEFKMEIAGHTARVLSLFESTREYCRRYLSEKEPDFCISVTREDLAFEQRELDEEARLEGMKRRKFTDPFLERAAIQRQFAEFLFDRNILLIHGSTVAVDGRGYLFTASCGTGKSTHTRLWMGLFPDRAVTVNDDKPFVCLGRSEILVCGSPWSGKHGLDTNVTVPLQGICILERGTENRISPICPEQAMDMLLHQSYRPGEAEKEERYLKLVEQLARRVPLWHMYCNREPEAARVSYEAMSGNTAEGIK